MTREIKFAFWHNQKKEMWGVDSIDWRLKEVCNGGDVANLNDGVLLQYTNLLDKNGKEIYEGDLILYKYYRDNGYKERKFEEVGYIKILQGAAFILKSENDTPSDWGLLWSRMNNSDTKAEISIEVIGNVYENPELMGGKNG